MRHEIDEHVHAGTACREASQAAAEAAAARGRARSALSVTASDEPDIASAAISGVTAPKMASGTAQKVVGDGEEEIAGHQPARPTADVEGLDDRLEPLAEKDRIGLCLRRGRWH